MRKKFTFIIMAFTFSSLFCTDFTISMGSSDMEWNVYKAFNTYEAQVFTGIHEGLVSYHPATSKPVPAGAESWEISGDKKVYTFQLRKGIKFSNGDPITAKNYKESWIRALDPQKGSRFASMLDIIEGAAEYNSGESSKDTVGIEVISDQILQVTLNEPAPHFLNILCHYSFAAVHPVLLNLDDWNELIHMPVTGPYTVVSRSQKRVVLKKNSNYWDRENVRIERINLLFNQSPEWVMSRFNDYRIDWVFSDMDSSLLEDGGKMVIAPSFATSYYFFSNKSEEWRDPAIRKALRLLIPWENIYSQFITPGNTLVPPIPQYPDIENFFVTDKEKAMKLLDVAGYPRGKGLPEIVIKISSTMEEGFVPSTIEEAWSENLETEVRIVVEPNYVYYNTLSENDYTLAYLGWVGDYADPMTFLQMWKSGSSFNDAGFSSEEYDELLALSASKAGKERYEILSRAETILLRDAEVLPINHMPSFHLIDLRYVDGWHPNALDVHPLKDIGWKNGVPIPGMVKEKKNRTGS